MLLVSAAQTPCATPLVAPVVASTGLQRAASSDAASARADELRAGWRPTDFDSATGALADALHAALGQLARLAEGVAYANHRATIAERMAVVEALQALSVAVTQARAEGPLAASCAAAAAIPWANLNSKRQQVCHARGWHARLAVHANALPRQAIAGDPVAPWIKPRPDVFARIVAGFAHLRERADLQSAVQAVLAERRLKLFPEFASAWLAVLRPDVYPQWPGLARFLPAMLAAHARDPRVLRDHAAYSEALMQAAAPDLAGPSLLDFLVRFGKPVLHLLVCLATGRPIDRNTTRMVLGSDAIRQMRPLTALIEAHAPLIRQCVQHSYSRGFPVRWSEIHLVLARRGVRLSSPQIAFIPEVLDDIERCGTWFFPVGEAPAQLHRFPLGYRVVRWYFGSPPDDLARLPAEPGCCEKLLALWPTGFSRTDVLATLALRQPGLTGRARQHVVHDWIRQRLIVCMGGGLWMVNPDFLCRAASLEVLARCPPRETWPDSLLADDADLQDALREAADEAAPDSPESLDGAPDETNDWPRHAWPVRTFSRGVGGWRSVDESIANACQDDTLQLPRARPDGPALLAVLRPALDDWGTAHGLAWLPVDLAPEPWRVMDGGGFDGLLVRAVIASELTGRALARSANKRFYARIHGEGGPDLVLFDGEVRPLGVTDFGHGQAGFRALVAVPADGGPARLQALLECACLPGVAAWCLAAPMRPGTAGERLRHLLAGLQDTGGTPDAERLARLLAQAQPIQAVGALPPDPSCPPSPPAPSTRPTEVRVPVSQRARDAALIFEVVGELQAAGTLLDHLLTDTAGHRTLSVKSLTRAVVERHPGVYPGAVSDVLIGLTPDNVGPLLARRQWLQPRVTFAQMEAALGELSRDFPLYFCLARSEIAQRINQRLPHSYCEAATFTSYTRSAPRDRRAAETMLDECIADGRIYWFCLGPRNRHLDHPALLDYLAQHGIGLSHKALQATWLRKSRAMPWDEQVFVHPGLASSPRARQYTARRVMERLGLAVGQPMPSWDEFLRAFEALFCAGAPAGAHCRYPAHMAVGIHRALERVLAGEVAPPPGAATRRRVGRRLSPTAPRATRKRPVQTAAGELPAAKRRATAPVVPVVAPFRTWVRQDDAVDGLHDLYRAVGNLAQDPAFLPVRAGQANRRVDIDDALRLPSLPGGSGWAPLRLSARHFGALAPLLVARLDAALLYRDNTLRSATRPGRFAAVRRHDGRLFLLDGRSAGAEQVTAADAVRQIGAACGGFWAALPRSVCEGVVGQCVSYHGVPGFLDGCDAVQAVAGGPPPIAAFAGWLDGHLSLDGGEGHEALHARRRAAYPGIDLGHVAGFLRYLGHGARWRPLRGLPALVPADAGEAFVLEVEREVYSHAQGTCLLLKMPTAPHIVALALEQGDICARVGGGRVPWRVLVAQALRSGRPGGAGLFVPFTA